MPETIVGRLLLCIYHPIHAGKLDSGSEPLGGGATNPKFDPPNTLEKTCHAQRGNLGRGCVEFVEVKGKTK